MDEKDILLISPVCDAGGNLYIPTNVFPYDGGMLRCRADRIAPDGGRESGFLVEEFCPRVFLPYLERQRETRRLTFRPGEKALALDYEKARTRFWTRLSALPQIDAHCGAPGRSFIRPFQKGREAGGTVIISAGGAVTLREFVKTSRPHELTAPYVRQCLTVLLALTEKLKALEGRWLVPALTPDSVLISHVTDESGVHVQLSDAAYLFPISQTPFDPFSSPLSWRKGDFPSDDFTDRRVAEACGASMSGGPGPLPPEVNGLYSVSQLLCYLLFVKPWGLNAETLSVHFPPGGVLNRQALRESLEEAAALGLRLWPASPGRMGTCEEFERLLTAAKDEAMNESETVFPS